MCGDMMSSRYFSPISVLNSLFFHMSGNIKISGSSQAGPCVHFKEFILKNQEMFPVGFHYRKQLSFQDHATTRHFSSAKSTKLKRRRSSSSVQRTRHACKAGSGLSNSAMRLESYPHGLCYMSYSFCT